ncbi:FCS-Like Zinc finger 3-like [Miscanthus floridulus]|uniref:FCS-Like Zinc finger 3-like n=1 Tax=Miscanthus floridulus TaxID=154761 RepID=UPI003459CA62
MMASSSSSFFGIEPLDGGESETRRHAMDACSLCGKRLAGDCDIFMYRGDTPFCSEECRYHQMVRDDFGAGGENMRLKKERPATATSKEEQRQRRRHEPPAAAEPARVPLAANVPVAI